jgi:hypothetical protein
MLVTVKYDDEEPVTYKCNRDRVLFETIKAVLGLTVREIHPMLERMLAEGLDPITPTGDEFEFGDFDVPPPNANLNLLEAVEVCGRHAKTCEMLLSGEVDRARAVLRNSIAWLEFWRVRALTEELREMFSRSLKRLLDGPTMENDDG